MMAEHPDGFVLEAHDLRREYPILGEPLRVLDGVDLTLGRGGSVAIMGPSGAGKSTLLHILGTLDRPTSGRLRLEGIDPFELTARELATFRNRRLGFIFQDHHLLPQCTVLENVLVPTLVSRQGAEEAVVRARVLLDRVGLAERLDHRPAELSGGERQRVAVARALINEPSIVLCDEPTGNLDPKTSGQIADLFGRLREERPVVFVVVTHSPEFAGVFDRQLRLVEGRLRAA